MLPLIWTWLAIAVVLLVLITRDHRGGALTLSYFLSLSLIHIPGALTYLGDLYVSRDETLVGLRLTMIGAAMFVAGVAAAQYLDTTRFPAVSKELPRLDAEWLERVGRKFLLIGVFVFFIAIPIVAEVPSVTSVLSAFVGLLVIGMWLWLCSAVVGQRRRRQIAALATLPLLPLATLTFSGFVSFGVQWIVTVLAFLFVISRQRRWLIVGMPVIFYFGLSLFVAYAGERNAIRDLVWYEESDIATRLDRISNIAVNFELLDLDDPKHAAALDGRLNQNLLVGAAAIRYDEGAFELGLGSTIPLWSLIPRALWPDKPDVGGGRTVVSDYTGLYFPEGTSVGTGQVFEFYVNFGVAGIMIGMFAWGYLLMTLDRGIIRAIAQADMRRVLFRTMIGLTLVNPGGNLLEIMIAAIGALIATHLILFLDRKLHWIPTSASTRAMPRLEPVYAAHDNRPS